MKLSLDFVTKYAYFFHEIIFNNFLKKVLSSFICLVVHIWSLLILEQKSSAPIIAMFCWHNIFYLLSQAMFVGCVGGMK